MKLHARKAWVVHYGHCVYRIEQLILTGRGFMFTRMYVQAYNTQKLPSENTQPFILD